MMIRILSTTLLLFALTSCMTLPVNGKMGNEKFLGSATGFMSGSGTLTITTEDGVTCEGKFDYNNPLVPSAGGKGEFLCADEQSGNFVFTSDGYSGRGFGKTKKGKKFTFVFGNAPINNSDSLQGY